MSKKYKRFISLVMAFATIFFFTSTVCASGTQKSPTSDITVPTESLCSVRGSQLSKSLRETFSHYKIDIDNDTLLEVIPCGFQEGTTALAVTSKENTSLSRSVLVVYGEDGKVQSIPEFKQNASTRSFGFGDEIDIFRDNSIVLVYAVLYDRYISNSRYCYRPLHAQIMYTNNGNYNVSRVGLDYECYGFKCSYPGFVDQNEPSESHFIRINKTNPSPNRYYTSSNAYPSDSVICVNPGGGRHNVTYFMTLNGVYDSWTDPIPLNQVN